MQPLNILGLKVPTKLRVYIYICIYMQFRYGNVSRYFAYRAQSIVSTLLYIIVQNLIGHVFLVSTVTHIIARIHIREGRIQISSPNKIPFDVIKCSRIVTINGL